MKRCPQCFSLFEDPNRYCDLDGTPLIEEQEPTPPQVTGQQQSWRTFAVGAVAGLALGIVLFLIYYAVTRQPAIKTVSAGVSIQQPPAVSLPPQPLASSDHLGEPSPAPSLVPSPSASPTTSPSPSPKPSPSPSLEASPDAGLSSSAVSTGLTPDRVIIRLLNGAVIEADEAWKGPEGIWYRQQGLVALLDPAQIKSIDRLPPMPSPSPTP